MRIHKKGREDIDRHKNRTAEQAAAIHRQHNFMRAAIDAELDDALGRVDKRRRARCEKSLLAFVRAYCCGEGGFLEIPPPSADMRAIVEEMQTAVEDGTTPYHVRVARGHGKTSFVKCAIVWAIATGRRKFVIVVGASADNAKGILADIFHFIEVAPEFGQDFPEIAVPFAAIGGIQQRCAVQTYRGRRTVPKAAADVLILPTIPGTASSGATVQAVGFTTNTRGRVKGAQRPDIVVFDDLQNDDMAKSAERIAAAAARIRKTFMGLAGHRKKIAALMTSTPIAPGDLSEIFAEDGAWKTTTFKMVKRWPKGFDERNPLDGIWGEYAKVLRTRIALGDLRPHVAANRFYRAHRAELEADAQVLNPKNFDARTEVSAFQHALNILIRDGAEAFASEYQMQPKRAQTVYDLTYKDVLATANGVPAMRIPDNCVRVFAAVDVMRTAGLRWVVMAVGADRVAAVVSYGRFPADNSPLFDASDQFPVKQAKVSDALGSLVSMLKSAVFPSADGKRRYRIGSIGIDCGWMYRVVLQFCASADGCYAMKGIPYSAFAPRTRSGQLAMGITEATDWMYEKEVPQLGAFFGFHADYWREQAQRAWFSHPLTPSSLSVFGDAGEHLQFAQECTADHLVLKDVTRSGGDIWKWAVNGANHLGDCVTMCLALAHWKRAYSVGGDLDAAAVAEPAARVPRSARRSGIVCL